MTQEELLAPKSVREQIQQLRRMKTHEEEQRRTKKKGRTYKIPTRTKKLSEKAEKVQNLSTKTTLNRFIMPYSAAADAQDLTTSLQILDATIRLNYPDGDERHELTKNSRTTITHKKRRSTGLLFTGSIKNPKMEEPDTQTD